MMQVFLLPGLIVVLATLIGFLAVWWLEGPPSGFSLRHILLILGVAAPILGALLVPPLLIAQFARDLYAAQNLQDAYSYASRLIFGKLGFIPMLLVKEGRIERGENSLLHQVGGPGSMIVYNDSAVVTEQTGRLKRVLGTGYHSLERFERVWEIIDRRPQRRKVTVQAMTREGIPIACEVDVTFQIDDLGAYSERMKEKLLDRLGQDHPRYGEALVYYKRLKEIEAAIEEQGRTDSLETRYAAIQKRLNSLALATLDVTFDSLMEPYPATKETIFRAATATRMRGPQRRSGEQNWKDRIAGSIEGILRGIIAENRLDWLVAPSGADSQHPREVIQARLRNEMRGAAAGVGAKILRISLGEFHLESDAISKQWIEAWQAEWESRSLASQAEGEAELMRVDSVRIQAQAEVVITLIRALQPVISSEKGIQPYLLATRFVEALRWVILDPHTRDFARPEAVRTLHDLQRSLLGQDQETREALHEEEA
jgi:hypothetical protein